MSWQYEFRTEIIEGLQVAHEYLHNPERSVHIRGWWNKGWRFEYTRADLNFRFHVHPDYKRCPDRLQPLLERDHRLGPACTVYFDKKNLCQLLAKDDCSSIVVDIMSALKCHWQFKTAVPPPIERIAFSNDELARLSD